MQRLLRNAWDRRTVSLGIPLASTSIESKNISLLAELERLEAFARCFPHPRELFFKSFIRGINALGRSGTGVLGDISCSDTTLPHQ